jgi:hypothetical protein
MKLAEYNKVYNCCGYQDTKGLKKIKLVTSWQKGSLCTHSQDLNLPVAYLREL